MCQLVSCSHCNVKVNDPFGRCPALPRPAAPWTKGRPLAAFSIRRSLREGCQLLDWREIKKSWSAGDIAALFDFQSGSVEYLPDLFHGGTW